ncbi:MAG TPA: ATP-binding protein, partial [Steroidobacteraceae bacterium]|nr:ATP-binding protein [Steroidobacteraceae bacterium]
LTRAVPVRDHNGELVRWCGTSTDIDAQKRAAEELRLVTDQAEVLLLHCDRNLRFVFVNRAYAARLGASPDSLIGKYVPEVLGQRAYGAIEAHLQQVLRGESVTFECMIPYEHLGEKFMQGRCVPDIDPTTREVKGLVAVLTDLTSRRELEEQLREADRRKDEFLAILGHELRNPLAPIRYATGLLKPGVPEQIVTAAQSVIERQVTHMARLIDDLLDVSRITRNTLELRMEFVDVRSVVNNVVETVRPLLESVRHKLTVSIPPSAVHARADVTRLSQVIGNLLNNAAKYTEPGGHIQLTLDVVGGRARIRVRDNGIGIDPEFQARMFDLFVQGDQTQTRASGGLGVGLAVAKRLIEMHGGAIEVHSRGRGRGSEFTVSMPLSHSAPATHDGAALENVAPMFQRRQQLLIVDDNLDAANSLATLLQLSGYVTHIANDGLAAIEMADLIRPEAIIMDLGMPRMTGHEAARWVRQQPWGSQTVLIAATGWGQEEDRRRSREAGFDVHLTKPVDSTTLLHELQQRSIRASEHESSERAS